MKILNISLLLIITGLLIYIFTLSKGNHSTDRMMANSIKLSSYTIEENTDIIIRKMRQILDDKPYLYPIFEAVNNTPKVFKSLLDELNKISVEIHDASGGIYFSDDDFKNKIGAYGYKNLIFNSDKSNAGYPVKPDNTSIPRKILYQEGKAEKIKSLIIQTRNEMFRILDALIYELEKNPIDGIKFFDKYVIELKENIALKLPDNSFSENFKNLTVMETEIMLRKIRLDALTALNQLIIFYNSNYPSRIIHDYRYDIIALTPKNCLKLGESYYAEIGLAVFPSDAEYAVNVNGQFLKVDGSKAKYSVKPKTAGTHKYVAELHLKNKWTGKIEKLKREFYYEVIP